MKKVFALLLTLCALAVVMSACTEEEPPHEHTFDSTWLYDESQHWHAAACEHTELESDRGDHVDADNNDICDTCGYIKDHVHSFDEGWTWDASNHWHKSACGHNVKQDETAHVDENNDAICDVCTYDYDHTHTYSEEWSAKGEDGHWHVPTCGHDVDGIDLTAHADDNNDGNCDTCGYNGGHEHTYAEKYSHTDDEHWREVTCGHDIPVADKGVHIDSNGDTTCDTCGYTPEHFHTFADTLTSDATNHWYASTCGHDVKNDETAHSGHDEDGVCDVCSHVVFHLYTITVSVPEYVKVIAPDGTETKSFIVKENTPVTFTVAVPDYAEIVEISGAKQEGKPTPDGEFNIYTFTIQGVSQDTTISVTGNKLSAVEIIVGDGQSSLNIDKLWKYTLGEVTFTAPTAGRYMIFSTSNEYVQFNAGAVNEDGDNVFTKIVFIDVTEPGDITVQTRFFAMNSTDVGVLDFTYVVTKVDNEITLCSLKADGYTLPTNSTVTVYFTAPKAGKYQISSSTLGMIWNDYVCDSIVLTATEDNQKMSFTICYENTNVASFNFDCDIVSMQAEALQMGQNTVTAPYGSYYAISFTAPEAGSYMIQAQSPYFDFYTWNDTTSTMTIQGNSYTANNMKKGAKVVLYVTVDIYEFDGTEDITDIVEIISLGYIPSLSGGVYNAQVGKTNSYISSYEASDFILSVTGGDQISIDGGQTWHSSIEVHVEDYGTVSYQVQSASDADTVKVKVERLTYEFNLSIGTQTQVMVPGKEYTVTLSGSADPAFYVSYILSWTDKNVVVAYNNQLVNSGSTISNFASGYAVVIVYNGTEAAQIEFTLTDPYTGGGSDVPVGTETIVLGPNAVDVTVSNNYCEGTTVTFTAPATGTYRLSAAEGEENAEVYVAVDGETTGLTLPYTFTAEKGETLTFIIATSAYMTLEADTIDLALERIPTGADLTFAISGTYNVNFLMTGLYSVTFDNGVLTVKDRNSGKESGDYRYFYTAADGIVVTNTDGSDCVIVITINTAGDMTFKCSGLPTAQPLVAA